MTDVLYDQTTKTYPAHYHAACNAAVHQGTNPCSINRARQIIADSLRTYRRAGDRDKARALLHHVIWIGYPIKVRAARIWKDSAKALAQAIEQGRLSDKPAAPNYAGLYMYMGPSTRGGDAFKHIETRQYID